MTAAAVPSPPHPFLFLPFCPYMSREPTYTEASLKKYKNVSARLPHCQARTKRGLLLPLKPLKKKRAPLTNQICPFSEKMQENQQKVAFSSLPISSFLFLFLGIHSLASTVAKLRLVRISAIFPSETADETDRRPLVTPTFLRPFFLGNGWAGEKGKSVLRSFLPHSSSSSSSPHPP